MDRLQELSSDGTASRLLPCLQDLVVITTCEFAKDSDIVDFIITRALGGLEYYGLFMQDRMFSKSAFDRLRIVSGSLFNAIIIGIAPKDGSTGDKVLVDY
jgi:hypothetical protein